MAGDTLIGGSGHDTLIGSSANDLIAPPRETWCTSGSGAAHDRHPPSGLSVTGSPLALTGSFVASNAAVSYTTTWHVIASNGQAISDVSQTYAAGQLSTTAATTASFSLPSSPSGVYDVTFTVTDGLGISRSVTATETVGTPLTAAIAQGSTPGHRPDRDHTGLTHHAERDRRLDLRVDGDPGRIEHAGGDRHRVELHVLTHGRRAPIP